jgi:hypothetical protein
MQSIRDNTCVYLLYITWRFSAKKFAARLIYDTTATKHKVSLCYFRKLIQTFFEILSHFVFFTTTTNRVRVTNFFFDPSRYDVGFLEKFLRKILKPITIYSYRNNRRNKRNSLQIGLQIKRLPSFFHLFKKRFYQTLKTLSFSFSSYHRVPLIC